MASEGWPSPALLLLFAFGAAIMRAAGCVLNDIVDRDFDARVTRTAARPIASGVIKVPQAVVFFLILCALGLLILLQFNLFTILLGAASLLLVALYPFAKRVTYWPQFVLGLAFNWGTLLGWSAIHAGLDTPALLLYAAGILWTLGYDTIYAHQDKEDDVLIGVKSTALRFGQQSRAWVAGFYAGSVILLAGAGFSIGLSWAFHLGLIGVAGHYLWQIKSVAFDDPKSCLRVFRSNQIAGLLTFSAMVAGRVMG